MSDLSSSDKSHDTSYEYSSSPNHTSSSASWTRPQDKKVNKNKSYETQYVNTIPEVSDWKLTLPAIRELTALNSNSEDEEIRKFKNLTLDSYCESLTIEKIANLSLNTDHKPLAGVVTSVAKVIGLIVVKPPIPRDVLLHLGSPVFLKRSCRLNSIDSNPIGWIIDVFGPACEPYYCVKPVNNIIEMVHEGTQIFYSPDHPRTEFLCLKKEDGNRYTVLYSSARSSSSPLEHRRGKPNDRDLWNRNNYASRSNSPRQRRRRVNNQSIYNTARNKYRNDLHEFPPIQPKHLYFDY